MSGVLSTVSTRPMTAAALLLLVACSTHHHRDELRQHEEPVASDAHEELYAHLEYFGYDEDGELVTRGYIDAVFPDADEGRVHGKWAIVPVDEAMTLGTFQSTYGEHIGAGEFRGTLYSDGELRLKLNRTHDTEAWLILQRHQDRWEGEWVWDVYWGSGRSVHGRSILRPRLWRTSHDPSLFPRSGAEGMEGTIGQTRHELMTLCRIVRLWDERHAAVPSQPEELFDEGPSGKFAAAWTAFHWYGDTLVDPWGTEYRMEVDEDAGVVTIISAGGDREFGTDDDLVSACHLAREQEPTDGGG